MRSAAEQLAPVHRGLVLSGGKGMSARPIASPDAAKACAKHRKDRRP